MPGLLYIQKRYMSTEFKKFFGISESITKLKIKNDKMLSATINHSSRILTIFGGVWLGLGLAINLNTKQRDVFLSFSKRSYYKFKLGKYKYHKHCLFNDLFFSFLYKYLLKMKTKFVVISDVHKYWFNMAFGS